MRRNVHDYLRHYGRLKYGIWFLGHRSISFFVKAPNGRGVGIFVPGILNLGEKSNNYLYESEKYEYKYENVRKKKKFNQLPTFVLTRVILLR